MYEITKYSFTPSTIQKIKDYRFGLNWPIVYIIEDGREAYVGESVSAYNRAKQQIENPERARLKNLHVIADDEYNKSATLDIESSLIKYMSGDGKYLLQNGNSGVKESDYYDRERYQAKFEVIWKELLKRELANQALVQIENSDLFKYSPYKSLSEDQLNVVQEITESIKKDSHQTSIVSGEPGTGKTIVAVYLMKYLYEQDWAQDLRIGLVIPMTSLRKTLKKVFKSVKGLNPGMVIGPNDVIKFDYDILIVDEAHRLQRRVNLTNYRDFDRINKTLGLKKEEGTELDWIINSSKHQVLFYDKNQSIKPADIREHHIRKYKMKEYALISQMRVRGGQDYIEYIRRILNVEQKEKVKFDEYELKLFGDIRELVDAIKEQDKNIGLSRLLAGYSWEWKTKKDESIDYDIEIDDVKLRWNSVTKDWVNSENAVNEVGCIHTIQGYDLNYAGVIIGPEISYDKDKKSIVIDKSKYLDFNGKRAISDPNELESYIKNIYKTLLTRGIRGTYVYVVDKRLRKYLKEYMD
ncbi:DUF2075 domain-containing protein [Candidatus Dojkabacteria bacterium]|nr:DUF2075 domain-containing protein [Candidatus Dojkabacteria bacterium]